MSVRPRRERAAVDYSEAGQLENNGVQGWARSAGLSLKHLEEENKISKGGNGKKASPTDKENSAGKDKQLEVDKPGKKNTADKPGIINSTDASKTQKIASRGRFAGHTVVPIGEFLVVLQSLQVPLLLINVITLQRITKRTKAVRFQRRSLGFFHQLQLQSLFLDFQGFYKNLTAERLLLNAQASVRLIHGMMIRILYLSHQLL